MSIHSLPKSKFFSRLCFGVLLFCLCIILWGAWVRISHSGDGCGPNWPDCQGEYLIDKTAPTKTWIEWTHRASTSIFGIFVILLLLSAFIKFPKKHPVRTSALCILFFTITEALIGAILVKFHFTGNNFSPTRVLAMNLHLINSLLLTSSLFLCWRFSFNKAFSFSHRKYFPVFILIFFVIAFFGSISALSATLFPSNSLIEGFLRDLNFNSNWLVRLRWLHPLLAILLGGGFAGYCHKFFKDKKTGQKDKSLILFTVCLGLALLSGILNLLLLSPVFLKLSHLLIVYLLAMSFLLSLEKPQRSKNIMLMHS